MKRENIFAEPDFTSRERIDGQEGRGWVCSNCGGYNKKKVQYCGGCNLTQAQATKRSLNRIRKLSSKK